QYFAVFAGIKKFIDFTIQIARNAGYVETLFNRKRYLPDLNASTVMIRKAAERMAINMPVQGTAADIIKMAMIEISRIIYELNPNKSELNTVRMLLQVHDELLFEIKEEVVEEMSVKIKNIMENIIKLKVPVIVDVKVGDNWGEMFSHNA
ncbi:DNA polymerase I, partial [Patescibacteria group bacterium]|nr:DNA polymerase I [Patescibacteria group bacterium]